MTYKNETTEVINSTAQAMALAESIRTSVRRALRRWKEPWCTDNTTTDYSAASADFIVEPMDTKDGVYLHVNIVYQGGIRRSDSCGPDHPAEHMFCLSLTRYESDFGMDGDGSRISSYILFPRDIKLQMRNFLRDLRAAIMKERI